MLAVAPQTKGTTDKDRLIGTRQIEFVHRLRIQPGRESLWHGFFLAPGKHVGRDVTTVHVQTRSQIGQEQTPRATSDIEGGLAIALDAVLEVGDLWSHSIELRPPLSHQTIMPDLWLRCHGATSL